MHHSDTMPTQNNSAHRLLARALTVGRVGHGVGTTRKAVFRVGDLHTIKAKALVGLGVVAEDAHARETGEDEYQVAP